MRPSLSVLSNNQVSHWKYNFRTCSFVCFLFLVCSSSYYYYYYVCPAAANNQRSECRCCTLAATSWATPCTGLPTSSLPLVVNYFSPLTATSYVPPGNETSFRAPILRRRRRRRWGRVVPQLTNSHTHTHVRTYKKDRFYILLAR